jgi:hypothetical protein
LSTNDGDVAFCDDAVLLEASHTFANGSHKKRSHASVPHDSFKINHSSDTLSHMMQREKSRTEGFTIDVMPNRREVNATAAGEGSHALLLAAYS